MKAPLPPDEAERLAALRSYDVLDTPPEAAFDDLTALAAQICQVPAGFITLVDETRQWYKSAIGTTDAETPREISFCSHALLQPGELLEVPDARLDARFADNPMVTSDPHIRFYAGAPLVTPDGFALGTLCVVDSKPRVLTSEQASALRVLSKQVVTQLELRRNAHELKAEVDRRQQMETRLRSQNEFLENGEQEKSRMLALAENSRTALLSVLEDEQRAGKELEEREQRFRQLTENINIVFSITDLSTGVKLYVSPAYEKTSGRSCQELYDSPSSWLEAVHPDDRERVKVASDTKAVLGTYDEVYRIEHPDGSIRWINDRAFPIANEKGEIYRLVGTAEDITARRLAEEELRWKTAFLEAQVDSSPDAILVVSTDGKKILQNQRLNELWKLPREIIENPDDGPQLQFVANQTRKPVEFIERVRQLEMHPEEIGRDEIELTDGTILDRYSSPVCDKAGIQYGRIWAFRDITERKIAQQRIAQQAALIDQAHDAIVVRDLNHHILFWSKGAERLYGWTADEVTGRDFTELTQPDPETLQIALETILDEGSWNGEINKTTKAGSSLTVESRCTLLRDSQGQPSSILDIGTDITEKKRLESQFLRAQRMEGIGTLAGGIAHDLNNTLTPILMSIEVLRDMVTEEDGHQLLSTLQSNAERGAELVRQVLSFARGVEGRRLTISLPELMREIFKIMQDTFPKSINLNLKPGNSLWNVSGDPTQIHQVFLNLCVNARDAMPSGGHLTIDLENISLDETYASMNRDALPGKYVRVTVEDTGTGISTEIQEKIFEPFFTTKEIGEGTGLGLSTTLAIVKSHGGFISLRSEPGKGTRFQVYFPALAGSVVLEQKADQAPRLPRGSGELVLVVDDEESIRQIAQGTLEHFGYRVLLANNGTEAVARYAQQQQEIAVVLTDMAMPIMDGAALIVALKAINPAVRIISSTGLSAEGDMAKALAAGVKHFIQKPYTAESMLKVLAELLKA